MLSIWTKIKFDRQTVSHILNQLSAKGCCYSRTILSAC